MEKSTHPKSYCTIGVRMLPAIPIYLLLMPLRVMNQLVVRESGDRSLLKSLLASDVSTCYHSTHRYSAFGQVLILLVTHRADLHHALGTDGAGIGGRLDALDERIKGFSLRVRTTVDESQLRGGRVAAARVAHKRGALLRRLTLTQQVPTISFGRSTCLQRAMTTIRFC